MTPLAGRPPSAAPAGLWIFTGSSTVALSCGVKGSKIWPSVPPRGMANLEQTCCMKVGGQPTLGTRCGAGPLDSGYIKTEVEKSQMVFPPPAGRKQQKSFCVLFYLYFACYKKHNKEKPDYILVV